MARALAVLTSFPRIDSHYDLQGGTSERPEVAVLQGLLLGYPLRDVDYYLRTRYLGEPKLPHVEIPGTYQYVRDPNT